MPTLQHTRPQIPSPSSGHPGILPGIQPLPFFLARKVQERYRWGGSRGRSKEGGQSRGGMLKEGRLGWMDLNRSKKLLSVIPGSGGEKEETGRGRLDGELGGGAGRTCLSPSFFLELLFVHPSLNQAQRRSSDTLVVSVPAGQLIQEMKHRAGRSWGLLRKTQTPAPGER